MRRKMLFSSILVLIFSAIVIFFGYILFCKGISNFTYDNIGYTENNNVNYKVYLKDNDFFETSYLDKDGIYITSLIKNLDIDFDYKMIFKEPMSGTYRYYIKGIISASKVNSDDSENNSYWQKEYVLTEPKEVKYDSIRDVNFSENLKVSYDKYNEILLDFKKQYNLSLDGSLKVMLCVENEINSKYGNHTIKKVSAPYLTIPLTKATIEVPIKVVDGDDGGILKGEKIILDDLSYTLYKVTGFACMFFGIVLFIFKTVYVFNHRRRLSNYIKQKNRILKEYDNIIVDVEKLPDLSDFNVVDAVSFSELIDAHSEVRLPINYLEQREKAIFVLIGDKVAWRYELRKDDCNEKDK